MNPATTATRPQRRGIAAGARDFAEAMLATIDGDTMKLFAVLAAVAFVAALVRL